MPSISDFWGKLIANRCDPVGPWVDRPGSLFRYLGTLGAIDPSGVFGARAGWPPLALLGHGLTVLPLLKSKRQKIAPHAQQTRGPDNITTGHRLSDLHLNPSGIRNAPCASIEA